MNQDDRVNLAFKMVGIRQCNDALAKKVLSGEFTDEDLPVAQMLVEKSNELLNEVKRLIK